MKLKIQFLSHTSKISSAQKPHTILNSMDIEPIIAKSSAGQHCYKQQINKQLYGDKFHNLNKLTNSWEKYTLN